ncbi:hypothetical protein GCM10011392_24570 [Wenxinia marina]|uniref:Anti-sigma factor NepR domain-containing protein n=1 Tax=Wenxinia marina DSM 24838 TaxID=1123501 RepID=A0A0D0Q8N1_9RHOB|nr:NepR family anti-sigma factor [Wenxinia marina]KIQ67478.1 hypothetical protein Wenmar_03901 [Wenxinia marina DSM 24838]GGL69210.1 hypothetical protein GCM10011392_24570 [Wenxinia marina]
MTGVDMAEQPSKSTIRRQINDNLRRVYEDALNEEIPDKFKDLLDKLRDKEGRE